MRIIDAQVHIWSKTVVPTFALHRKVATFTVDELLREMDEAGVDAALIHPPVSWDPDTNALAVAAAKKYPVSRSWASFRWMCRKAASCCMAGVTSRA